MYEGAGWKVGAHTRGWKLGTIELLAFRSSEILEVRISSDKNVINVKYLYKCY